MLDPLILEIATTTLCSALAGTLVKLFWPTKQVVTNTVVKETIKEVLKPAEGTVVLNPKDFYRLSYVATKYIEAQTKIGDAPHYTATTPDSVIVGDTTFKGQ